MTLANGGVGFGRWFSPNNWWCGNKILSCLGQARVWVRSRCGMDYFGSLLCTMLIGGVVRSTTLLRENKHDMEKGKWGYLISSSRAGFRVMMKF